MIKFYDTCSLLNLQQKIFDSEFCITNIVLSELESIKTSGTRDEETRWQARKILHLLEKNQDKYTVYTYFTTLEPYIDELNLIHNNDSRIIIQAKELNKIYPDIEFYTADLTCYMIAAGLGIPAHYTEESAEDGYTGFITVEFDDDELALFYAKIINENNNTYNLYNNQYILVKYDDQIIDKYVWKEDHYEKVNFIRTQSKMFGKILPKDEYQQLVYHSFTNNQITMVKGPAGTGKTLLAFGYMFQQLEQGKIDKIIVFCNTVATKGSAKLGFYPGSRTEKLLDSQIGNLLESKLGDRFVVEDLISKGQLVLLPMSDIRGYDTSGMNAAIYISEAQNLDIELMRLALQRIGEDSICILDGDSNAQVDLSMYAGSHNGMRRVSEVFRGHSCYGEVELQNIYRSEIGRIAQDL